jgi:hypothetical protein
LDHLPAWAGITIIVCLVLFLADFWFAIVTGRLIMVGLGALALVIAGVSSTSPANEARPSCFRSRSI